MIESKLAKNATHAGGKGEILHDWYPYLEGFSSEFVYFILDWCRTAYICCHKG